MQIPVIPNKMLIQSRKHKTVMLTLCSTGILPVTWSQPLIWIWVYLYPSHLLLQAKMAVERRNILSDITAKRNNFTKLNMLKNYPLALLIFTDRSKIYGGFPVNKIKVA